MDIYIRADASAGLGSGHVMRCLTLADGLAEHGAKIVFFCKKCIGDLSQMIMERGYRVIPLENHLSVEEDAKAVANFILDIGQPPNWLIVDHYSLDVHWEERVRPFVQKIMVIDDLANRKHDCDILLDQNYYNNLEKRYTDLVPGHCRLLLGPKYVLLRREFKNARVTLKRNTGQARRVLISYGGSDPTGETHKALRAIMLLDRSDLLYDVVVGQSNLEKDEIEYLCSLLPHTNYYCQTSDMASLMAKADFSLGAGGATTWERCFLGLPVIATSVARNQCETMQALADMGAIKYLGWHLEVSEHRIADAMKELLNSPSQLSMLSENSLQLMSDKQDEMQTDIVNVLLLN